MTEQNFDAMRQAMVASQLRTNGVNDPRILGAIKAVARERFVPDAMRASAYVDVAIPLGAGRWLSAPMTFGKLLAEAGIKSSDRVLIVGVGSGYAAAVVSGLSKHVVAVESDAGLASAARAALSGLEGVKLVEAALASGAPDDGPYDVVLIDGAIETMPDVLVAQVKERGRVATGLLENGVTRLAIGRKSGNQIGFSIFADAEIPALPGFALDRGFTF